jgi:hypothetical protein
VSPGGGDSDDELGWWTIGVLDGGGNSDRNRRGRLGEAVGPEGRAMVKDKERQLEVEAKPTDRWVVGPTTTCKASFSGGLPLSQSRLSHVTFLSPSRPSALQQQTASSSSYPCHRHTIFSILSSKCL